MLIIQLSYKEFKMSNLMHKNAIFLKIFFTFIEKERENI